MNRTPCARLRSERGVALAFVALLLFILLGLAALAVDIGILLGARTEAQRTADAAALAGASILLSDGQDEVGARATAIDYAARNTIRNEATVVLPGDVDVRTDSGLVRVRVYRTENRGSAIPNVFARAIGFPTSNVSAMGAAIAGAGNAVRCVLPFVLSDRFWSTSETRLANWTETFDTGDVYQPGARTANPAVPTSSTGWSNLDIGQIWRIYPGSTSQTPVAGYYYTLDLLDANAGQPTVNAWIGGCPRPELQFTIGQQLPIVPGRRVQPIQNAFDNVIARDNAEWDTSLNCPVFPGVIPQRCLSEGDSDRIRPILVVSPQEAALTDRSGRSAATDVTITNMVGVFIVCQGRRTVPASQVVRSSQCESSSGGGSGQQAPDDVGVWVRFMGVRGEMGGGSVPNATTLTRILRLVE